MIASGVVLGPKLENAASGTVVSELVAIEAPVEAPPRPLLVSWLSARFCSAASGACARLLLLAQLELALLLAAALVVAPALVVLLPSAAPEGAGLVAVLVQELVLVDELAAVMLAVALLALLAAAVAAKSATAPAEDCVPLSAPPEVLTQTSFKGAWTGRMIVS